MERLFPIIDLRIRFGVEATEDVRRVKWILIDVGGMTIGLVVDRVTEVFALGVLGCGPHPRWVEVKTNGGSWVVTAHEGTMVFVLDLARFEAIAAGLGRVNNLEPARSLLR